MRKRDCIATYILMALIVFIYILDRLIPLPEGYAGASNGWEGLPGWVAVPLGYCGGQLTNLLALCGDALTPGGWAFYRHFTILFPQENLFHLLAALALLYLAGSFVESHGGSAAVVGVFLLSGFLESWVSVPLYTFLHPPYMFDSPMAFTAGASSGAMGLLGAAWAICLFNRGLLDELTRGEKMALAACGVLCTYVLGFGLGIIRCNISLFLGLGLMSAACAWIPPVRRMVLAAVPAGVIEEAVQQEEARQAALRHEQELERDILKKLSQLNVDDPYK